MPIRCCRRACGRRRGLSRLGDDLPFRCAFRDYDGSERCRHRDYCGGQSSALVAVFVLLMCGFPSVIRPQLRWVYEPMVVISRRLRNRREARIHSLKGRVSYPPGEGGLPISAGSIALDVYLYGAVTAVFDTGAMPGVLRGAPGRFCAYRSLPVPAVATVVTVDEAGYRHHAASRA
jgi:hypothetical protein